MTWNAPSGHRRARYIGTLIAKNGKAGCVKDADGWGRALRRKEITAERILDEYGLSVSENVAMCHHEVVIVQGLSFPLLTKESDEGWDVTPFESAEFRNRPHRR